MDTVLEVLLNAGVWGLVLIVVGYVLRRLYEQVLSRDLKKLEQAGAADLERLRAELRLAGLERETRLVRLEERRGEILHELYVRLSRTMRAFVSLTKPLQEAGEPSQDVKAKQVAEAANGFRDYFDESRIYLDEPLCDRIDDLNSTLYEAWVDFTTYSEGDPERGRAWISAWKAVTEKAHPIRREIEVRFRDLLGVASPK